MQQQDTTPLLGRGSIPRNCEHCGAPFYTIPYKLKHGHGRFCSRRCAKARDLPAILLSLISPPTSTGCRPWMGTRDRHGYGVVMFQSKQRRATHAVWFLQTGHWPTPGEVIAHTTCDWPPCCEFSHLTLTDSAGNSADMLAKGRHMHGEGHYAAKLTAANVLEMRTRYAAGGVTMAELAIMFGVTYYTACDAVRGKKWRHLPNAVPATRHNSRPRTHG